LVNNDGEDGDPIDDWSDADLTQLNEKDKDDVASQKDVNKSVPIRSTTTPVKKKQSKK
tara:strand:- start:108 stop:281 length:174 start_codon:yes stop_codon:yes gene_type:complete